jgi:hypothetical protein
MLAFYDPDAAMQMDPEIFPSLHLGHTEMLPVCAADAEASRCSIWKARAACRCWPTAPGRFSALGQCCCASAAALYHHLRNRHGRQPQKHGGRPGHRLGAATERARRAGARRTGGLRRPQWHVPLEIRLYRCALVRKANVRLLWRKLKAARLETQQPCGWGSR